MCQPCHRNVLSQVAAGARCARSSANLRGAAAFAWVVQREGRKAPRTRGEIRTQAILDWALVNRDPEVQKAADALWREVLRHHRAAWECEAQNLIARWNDPTSPLHDLRRRLRGEMEDE